jgi:DNA-binding CsgD family transcriptional regulator
MDKPSAQVSSILDVIDHIEAQDKAASAFNAFREFTHLFGGTSLLIGKIINPVIEGQSIDNFGFADWPEEWQKRWVDENYILHDPISKYAMQTYETFEWDTAYAEASEFGKRILEEGRQYSSPVGIAIPIKAGDLPPGVVSIGFDESIPPPDDITRLEMVSIHCYTHLLRLLNIMEHSTPGLLTKRETDVLNYVAAGKTNWEVATIFGISEHSIAQHMKNICRKMNAANRAHAVTLAIKSGQIIT